MAAARHERPPSLSLFIRGPALRESTLRGEKQKNNSVAFSPDGSLIAAGNGGVGQFGEVRIYEDDFNIDFDDYGAPN